MLLLYKIAQFSTIVKSFLTIFCYGENVICVPLQVLYFPRIKNNYLSMIMRSSIIIIYRFCCHPKEIKFKYSWPQQGYSCRLYRQWQF